MAERGVDADNPFSFKKFVSSKDKTGSRDVGDVELNEDIDADDIFSVSDLKLGPAKPEKSRDEPTPGTQKGVPKKSQQKENPFSFKKFISSSPAVSKKGNNSLIISTENAESESSYTLPNQINGKINDHIIGLSSSAEKMFPPDSFHVETTDNEPLTPLDLFLDTKVDVTSDFRTFHYNEREDITEIDSPLSMTDGAASGPLALPDFLTDTAMLNSPGPGDDKTRENYEGLLDKIRLLQEDNDSLRSELNRERVKSQEKYHRFSQLKVDLERQKKKEVEDTAVLERAVQQVEENLVTTTQRAVQAEATVTKLKQEARTLQKQIKTLSAENEALKSGDRGLSDIRERTKYTSDQLKEAAFIAEKNVKELMVGVDKLKLLSQVLSSLEKVTDINTEMSQEDDTKPS